MDSLRRQALKRDDGQLKIQTKRYSLNIPFRSLHPEEYQLKISQQTLTDQFILIAVPFNTEELIVYRVSLVHTVLILYGLSIYILVMLSIYNTGFYSSSIDTVQFCILKDHCKGYVSCKELCRHLSSISVCSLQYGYVGSLSMYHVCIESVA